METGPEYSEPMHHAHDFGYGSGQVRWLLEGETDKCDVCGMEVTREADVLVSRWPDQPDRVDTRPLG